MGQKIISFSLEGDFAAFRDPSITTNQSVYFIPSKSSVVGIIGSIIGVSRSNLLSESYGAKYLDLFGKTKIGIMADAVDCGTGTSFNKVTLFTNHRSLKDAKTKPYKLELLECPRYTIFVQTSDEYMRRITHTLKTNEFVYSPYLGHMYCPAMLEFKGVHDVSEVDIDQEFEVSSVILDESETYKTSYKMAYEAVDEVGDNSHSKIIVERHLHHFMNDDDELDSRVLKHFIPMGNTKIEIKNFSEKPTLSEFKKIKNQDQTICVY